MRTLLALVVLTPFLSAQSPVEPHANLPFAGSEIRRVLLLARDAALQQQRVEGGMLGGWLPDRLQTLMTGFRAIDDWQDAVVLQKRVNKAHKVDVLYAPPHANPGDYQRLRHIAEQFDSEYDRDTGLQRIVSQELADGFVDDAEQSVSSIPGAYIRSQTYTDIAVFRWKQGQVDAAGTSFEAATNTALKMKDSFMVNPLQGEARQLDNIAKRRYEAGDGPGAVAMFAHLRSMAEEADEPFRSFLCGDSARTQAELGLFDGARSSVRCIRDEPDRKSVENEIAEQETMQSQPAKAIANAMGAADPVDQVGLLADIGAKQAEAGNKNEAMRALDQALGIVPHLSGANQWLAYRLRLIAVTYLRMGARDKGELALQTLRALKESAVSHLDQYDFLYDLAVGYAAFGHFDQAHSYISEMDNPNEQACNAVAYEQAQQGEADEAVIWAEHLRDPSARTSALVGIVEAMLDANEAHMAKTNR
ncbi:exported hypothetical protein [Candidatus Sulfotelmatobacter kueseliae]|uniref:Tetratricopeptide repeat protein n=1 Tax=Candidatus Sulfotelmatobacter kueseliae TaxID=2042962 RepID=A0A2U3K8W0_9BACT|nr:exported hypothetical protein [Candidatus Sulfotelmatobacter kueseliae]